LQGSLIGVGSALRKARLHRGVTIDESSRGTKIRPDYLESLEREEFDVLLGEVYVRAALRTYACYLGLDADKVLQAYSAAEGVDGPPAPEPPGQIRREIGAARRRDNHRLAGLVVAVVLILAAGFGLLSSRNSTPAPASLPESTTPNPAGFASVLVGVEAVHNVQVTAIVDGITQTVDLVEGEGVTFEGEELVTIHFPRGKVAHVSVGGESLGLVGERGEPFEDSFAPTSEAPPSPTPVGAPSPTA
jgi:hypothetical protein